MEKELIDITKSTFSKISKIPSNFPFKQKGYMFKGLPKDKVGESRSTKDALEERKEKIKKWMKNNDNLIFFGIMAFAIIIRLYYFWITKSQALWWDESDYLAYAKTLAGMGTSWVASSQHNSLFPYIVAAFFTLGFSELVIKLALEIIPSIILVFLTYKICESVYRDKKIAIISTFVMAVFWNILFNSTRFHLEAPGLMLAFLAIYSFFVGYENRQKIFGKINPNWAIPIAVTFTIFSYMIRRNYAFFGVFFLIYMLSTKKITELVKDKYNWIGLAIAAVLIILAEKLIFISSVSGVASQYYHPEEAINWIHIGFLKLFFQGANIQSSIFFWLSIIGLILIISRLGLAMDYIRKKNNTEIKFEFYLIMSMVITLAYFIFFQRGTAIGEPRWYFPMLLAALILVSRGAVFISDQIKKYNKQIAIVVLILLVAVGGYYQLQQADQIIKMKIPSYAGVRDAGLKVQSVSNSGDVIISSSVPQIAYYSERTVIHFSDISELHSENEFQETLEYLEQNSSIKYIAISFSEPNNPRWARNEAEEYGYQNGQVMRVKWEIPFMDTIINFQTGEEKILKEKVYGKIKFSLVSIEKDVFIYEVIRV